MDAGGDASTKRPLLAAADEEASATERRAPSSAAASRSFFRRARPDSYGPLQASEDAAEDEAGGDRGSGSDAEEGGDSPAFHDCAEEFGEVSDGEPLASAPSSPGQGKLVGADVTESVSAAAVEPSPTVPVALSRMPALPCAAAAEETRFESSHREGVVIEMQDLAGQPTSPGSTSDTESRSVDRTCFICLDDDSHNELIPCCSTCHACVHEKCWREWRNSQRITALRARLLGQRAQTNHLLQCTICKSGTAVVAGEEDGLEWMNDLLCGTVGGSVRNVVGSLLGAGSGADFALLRPRSEEDDDAAAELADAQTCVSCFAVAMVFMALSVAGSVLALRQRFYAGDVVLCCFVALYELSVFQIAALAICRRRRTMMDRATARNQILGAPGQAQAAPGGGQALDELL